MPAGVVEDTDPRIVDPIQAGERIVEIGGSPASADGLAGIGAKGRKPCIIIGL
jgi:hypothetical protein